MAGPEHTDPSGIVIPFGKHRGSTVEELLVRDPAYVEWLLGQNWLAQRFAELHTALVTRGAGTDDTPEHNQLQVRFLDRMFCLAFLSASECLTSRLIEERDAKAEAYHRERLKRVEAVIATSTKELEQAGPSWMRDRHEHLLASAQTTRRDVVATLAQPHRHSFNLDVKFEQRGIDVVLQYGFSVLGTPYDVLGSPIGINGSPGIELKPSMGDDYPSVMRQMQRLHALILVIERYAGTVPLRDVRRMFLANDMRVVLLREIEAEL